MKSKIVMHAKSFQLCLTLCDPMECSLPASSAHILIKSFSYKFQIRSPKLPERKKNNRSPTRKPELEWHQTYHRMPLIGSLMPLDA